MIKHKIISVSLTILSFIALIYFAYCEDMNLYYKYSNILHLLSISSLVLLILSLFYSSVVIVVSICEDKYSEEQKELDDECNEIIKKIDETEKYVG